MSRARIHLLAWLLILATLAAAVLPPFAHAYLHDHGVDDLSVEAYAHHGVKLIHLPNLADESSSSQQADSHLEYCPFCMQHACHGLPAVIAFDRPPPAAAAVFTPSLYLSPRPLFAWLIPASRAPPSQLS